MDGVAPCPNLNLHRGCVSLADDETLHAAGNGGVDGDAGAGTTAPLPLSASTSPLAASLLAVLLAVVTLLP